MRAKKYLGQHFLTNKNTCRRIVELVQDRHDPLLEIGPGKGALTQYLLQLNRPLKVVEIDRDMIKFLTMNWPKLEQHILAEDFLQLRLDQVFSKPYQVIGNFPYYISSQIIFHILDYYEWVQSMVGMFQKEVALRITSSPGSKSYGIISVLTQMRYHTQYHFSVHEQDFQPAPNVKSAVIELTKKTDQMTVKDYKRVKTIVKMAFNQRRKMLRNSLKSLASDPALLQEPIFTKRPEQLGLEEFYRIREILTQHDT